MRGEYATYKNDKITTEATYFSTLTHILDDALILETSIPMKVDEISKKLNSDCIYPINDKNFLVREKNEEFLSTKFLYRYRLNVNFENHGGLEQVDLCELKNMCSSKSSVFHSKLKLLMIQGNLKFYLKLLSQ